MGQLASFVFNRAPVRPSNVAGTNELPPRTRVSASCQHMCASSRVSLFWLLHVQSTSEGRHGGGCDVSIDNGKDHKDKQEQRRHLQNPATPHAASTQAERGGKQDTRPAFASTYQHKRVYNQQYPAWDPMGPLGLAGLHIGSHHSLHSSSLVPDTVSSWDPTHISHTQVTAATRPPSLFT